MFDFLDLPSTTVVYEAANILAALTNNSVVLKGYLLTFFKKLMIAAASKFIELAIKESDNNIKLIVLDKMDKLHAENEGILEDLVMEVLVVLSR
jgi:coatomer subunit beta